MEGTMGFPKEPMERAIRAEESRIDSALRQIDTLRSELEREKQANSVHRCHDDTCFVLGVPHPCHDPKCGAKQMPDFVGMRRTIEEHEATIRFMATNVHQAWHREIPGGWWDCPRNVCNAAQQALPELVKKLKGPDHI